MFNKLCSNSLSISKSIIEFFKSSFDKISPTKVILVFLLFGLSIPVAISEVHANAACTAEIKTQIQREIDTLSILETVPTVQERSVIKKQDFDKIKQTKTRIDLDQVKVELVQNVKNRFAIINDSYNQDYAVTFDNLIDNNSSISGKATVLYLVDLNDGRVITSNYNYEINLDKKSSQSKITLIKDELPKASQEDIQFTNNLREHNEVNGVLKGNSLGQSDEEWSKLKETKSNAEKKAPNVDYIAEQAESIKDHRLEFKNRRVELESAKKNINCNGIKVSGGLGGNPLNRNAVASYVANWWYRRNSSYANFDLNGQGGDCTNFASQAMQAGGYGNDADFYSERTDQRSYGQNGNSTYPNNTGQWFYTSPSFRGVGANKQYIKNRWYTSDYHYYRNYLASNTGSAYYSGYGSQWASMFNDITTGDVVYADWENDGTWDHIMIIDGWYWSGGYRYPYFAYHSTDRYDMPFSTLLSSGWYPNANFVSMRLDNVY